MNLDIVRDKLFLLLDLFPDAAYDLHSALVGDAIDGRWPDAWGSEFGCSDILGTVADSLDLERGDVYDIIGWRTRSGVALKMFVLPDLGYYDEVITPGGPYNRRRLRLICWIEEWMSSQSGSYQRLIQAAQLVREVYEEEWAMPSWEEVTQQVQDALDVSFRNLTEFKHAGSRRSNPGHR